jgi:hypothetical protein
MSLSCPGMGHLFRQSHLSLDYLSRLGHHFSARKKTETFYVDGHERVESMLFVEARNNFCRWYLKMEVCCCRWVQLTLKREQVDCLVEAIDLPPSLFASGFVQI